MPNGGEGTNRLVFRVPVDRAEDALAAFGRLGVGHRPERGHRRPDRAARRQATAADALRASVAELRARAAADPADAALAAELARAEAALGPRRGRQRAATLSAPPASRPCA